jgi:elongator complex protein 2
VCLFAPASAASKRGEFGPEGWRLVTRFKAHDREIFAAAWAPCGTLFATAGRDKKIKLWRWTGDDCALEIELPKFAAAPTAVAFAPADAGLALAIGFEDGTIDIYTCAHGTSSWTLAARTAPNERHGAAVRDVKWRPRAPYALASCANDHAVHVYDYTP